jgi:hypothetical protein
MTAACEYVSFEISGAPKEKMHIYSGGITLFRDVVHSSQFKLLPTLNLALPRSNTTEVLALGGIFFGGKDWVGQISGLTLAVGYQSGTVTTGVEITAVL